MLRWNPVSEWEVSERIAHEPLVDDETFVAVQGMRMAKPAKDGEVRRYLPGVAAASWITMTRFATQAGTTWSR
ncbi:hypothetical protein [Lentzea sp. NPDC092896]|uniref:hypothetical protein n=1 Tax=Lentzea sp. NPDC092896 TaxID=3364127 RepID=UPI0038179E17